MSYEAEKKELAEWYDQRCDEYHAALDRDSKGDMDSEHDVWHKEDTQEFNRRLIALKEKYGIE